MKNVIDLDLLNKYTDLLGTRLFLLKRNTAYVKNDLVQRDGKYLLCMLAGTTASTTLNLSSVAIGNNITDGTVTWEVIDPFGPSITNWEQNKSYKQKDLVIYNNLIYQCISNNSDIAFTSSNWNLIGSRGVTNWESNKTYLINDLVMHESELYICITNNTSTTNFEDDVDNWLKIISASSEVYKQVNKLDITAPQSIEIPISKTKTFALPPVEVLKLDKVETDVTQNQFDFSVGDGSKFEIDGVVANKSPYIIFDETARPNHEYEYSLGTATKMVEGYYLESKEIDFSKFKVINGVSLT